jgi:hypothetical protein
VAEGEAEQLSDASIACELPTGQEGSIATRPVARGPARPEPGPDESRSAGELACYQRYAPPSGRELASGDQVTQRGRDGLPARGSSAPNADSARLAGGCVSPTATSRSSGSAFGWLRACRLLGHREQARTR